MQLLYFKCLPSPRLSLYGLLFIHVLSISISDYLSSSRSSFSPSLISFSIASSEGERMLMTVVKTLFISFSLNCYLSHKHTHTNREREREREYYTSHSVAPFTSFARYGQNVGICSCLYNFPIGAWNLNFPPFLEIMTDRPTSRRTDGQEGS